MCHVSMNICLQGKNTTCRNIHVDTNLSILEYFGTYSIKYIRARADTDISTINIEAVTLSIQHRQHPPAHPLCVNDSTEQHTLAHLGRPGIRIVAGDIPVVEREARVFQRRGIGRQTRGLVGRQCHIDVCAHGKANQGAPKQHSGHGAMISQRYNGF